MKNKKTIMAIATIMILIFHLWINVTNSVVESYLKQVCIVGVDLFFFASAYSISKKDNIAYKDFLFNRITDVYLKFIILSIIFAIYSGWDITKFIRTILGIELFTKGGGSFLWFIPSIMIVYLVLPLYKRIDAKYPKIVPIITFITYILASIIFSLYTDYHTLFIFTNRIPILLIGFYFAKYNVIERISTNKIKYFIISISLLFTGILISYNTYINAFKLSWFYDVFYILYIPLEIGLILLLDQIKATKLIKVVGSATLESYGLQMIIGFKLADIVYKNINIAILSNIIVIVLMLILSLILKYIFDLIKRVKHIILNNNKTCHKITL